MSAPLLGHRDLDQPVAWRDGAPVSCARFLGEAAGLADRLPPGRHLINLCEDRYRFAVVFAAALLAGRTSLFPASRHDAALARVAASYPDAGAIAEEPVPVLHDRLSLYPADLGTAEWSGAPPAIDAEQLAAIVFTSGSTGAPQPNAKRWGKLAAGGRAGCLALGLHPGEFNVLGTVPPQHMYGFESTVLLPFAAGGALAPERPLFPRDVAAALEKLPGPRVLVTSPIHIHACVESGVTLPALEAIVSAAAPLATELAHAAERRFATRVMEIYGFTEAGQVASRRTTESQVWRTLDGVRLVAAGDGWAVEGGPVRERVPVSDIIRPLSETEFVLVGRATDLVNVAGKRASLADLNRALTAIPGVADGAFHVPERPGDPVARLMAFVVAPRLSKREIMAALRRAVDPAFLPRPLVKVERLPRAPTGKLPLEALRALEAAESSPMVGDPPLVIAPDHPALPGHFPGHPVVPGVLLLGHVLAAFERRAGPVRLAAIPQAKFLGPLAAGEACEIEFPLVAAGEARFECRCGERLIARGTLRFHADGLDPR